jgi:hypothetical protein
MIGDALGQYRIVGKLGEGGMGVVYPVAITALFVLGVIGGWFLTRWLSRTEPPTTVRFPTTPPFGLDLLRKTPNRVTDSPSWDAYPLWQPGMRWVAFSSMRDGLASIFRQDLRSGTVEKLVAAEGPVYPDRTPG